MDISQVLFLTSQSGHFTSIVSTATFNTLILVHDFNPAARMVRRGSSILSHSCGMMMIGQG
jgi:hypothetical protein